MAVTTVTATLVKNVIQHLHTVGEELDEATGERMEQLSQEMTQLQQELEQRSLEQRSLEPSTQEQSSTAWQSLLFAALQYWKFWVIAGMLVLLFSLWWWLWKRSPQADLRDDSSSSDNEDLVEEEVEEEEEEEESEDDDDDDDERNPGRIFAKHIQWPKRNLSYRRRVVEELVGNIIHAFQGLFTNKFFPVLQPPIGVGSTFEGWSPQEDDAVYSLLIPMKPPSGHAFHLELGTPGEIPAKHACIRVDLECTCMNEQLEGKMLCFLHTSEAKLRRKQGPSLLHTLCTDSYLDVQKTLCWFQKFVRSAWMLLPQSHHYCMKVLPSSHSCKLQLTNISRRTYFVEVMFGVQQGDSDIFVSSHSTEASSTSNTMWPETYAVAEVKFFSHMARWTPHDSFHLKCLQLCSRNLVGTDFSTYDFKTAVMHLLTTIPLSGWCRKDFLLRLWDIMSYLHCCLEEKHLNHFFFGNENVPEEILLPTALERAEPLNLFWYLVQDPAAHAKALNDFNELKDKLMTLLFKGH